MGRISQPIERGHLRGTPHKLTIRLVLNFQSQKGRSTVWNSNPLDLCMEKMRIPSTSPLGIVLAAQRFVPIADESVELGRVALQIIRHRIEKGEPGKRPDR